MNHVFRTFREEYQRHCVWQGHVLVNISRGFVWLLPVISNRAEVNAASGRIKF